MGEFAVFRSWGHQIDYARSTDFFWQMHARALAPWLVTKWITVYNFTMHEASGSLQTYPITYFRQDLTDECDWSSRVGLGVCRSNRALTPEVARGYTHTQRLSYHM